VVTVLSRGKVDESPTVAARFGKNRRVKPAREVTSCWPTPDSEEIRRDAALSCLIRAGQSFKKYFWATYHRERMERVDEREQPESADVGKCADLRRRASDRARIVPARRPGRRGRSPKTSLPCPDSVHADASSVGPERFCLRRSLVPVRNADGQFTGLENRYPCSPTRHRRLKTTGTRRTIGSGCQAQAKLPRLGLPSTVALLAEITPVAVYATDAVISTELHSVTGAPSAPVALLSLRTFAV
jgi:hypothetical protein